MKWRVGQHYGIHVYEDNGDEPSDLDRPVATFHTALDAVDAVRAHNLAEGLSVGIVLHGYVKDSVWHETKDAYQATQVVSTLSRLTLRQGASSTIQRAQRRVYYGPVERID